jgi:hypothetical protein
MYFRQFDSTRDLGFIIWKKVNGRLNSGNSIRFGAGWQCGKDSNKQTFKLELIL